MVRIKKVGFLLLLTAFLILFYYPSLFFLKVPVPADTIVGLYSPFRDFYSSNYPNGIPYKNFLVTDPVRQTYVWKELAIDEIKKLKLPSWNPYEMTGKPLAANFQTGAFYPLNIIFYFGNFSSAWSIFILLQSVLLVLFSYIYLKNLKLSKYSSVLGSISISFSGFSISWLEWGNVISTFLWLPILLFIVDKIFVDKKRFWWYVIFTLALSTSFFAGHLQVFFYLTLIVYSYFLVRLFENKNKVRYFFFLSISSLVFLIITAIQWYPTLQFVVNSSRNIDQNFLHVTGWFLPWQNLVQFVAPDYFGNPATLNYFGIWNYAEFVGYIGVIPLILLFFSIFKKNSTVIFYIVVTIFAFIFMLPTIISLTPYLMKVPFISSAQPTRLILVVAFSFGVLSSFGFDYLIINKSRNFYRTIIPILIILIIFLFLWSSTLTNTLFFDKAGQADISKRNLILPTLLFGVGASLIMFSTFIKNKKVKNILFLIIILVTFFDLFRFGHKFLPFTDKSYLYPTTKTLDFLTSQKGLFRIASLDRRILAPNIATHYKLQSIEGYDPLYLKNFAEYITALERGKPDLRQPFGFNRIITPHNYNSQLFDLLNVKYILSFDALPKSQYSLVFEEGRTKVYLNNNFIERAFFVENTINANKIDKLFSYDLRKTAVVNNFYSKSNLSVGKIDVISYSEDKVVLKSSNVGDGFVVFTDAYYPTWDCYIDGVKTMLYKTDHAFRGFFVKSGNHEIVMKNNLF